MPHHLATIRAHPEVRSYVEAAPHGGVSFGAGRIVNPRKGVHDPPWGVGMGITPLKNMLLLITNL